jgi:molybdopterin/thiamine biosynthesis adenylyltransferase
MLPRLKEFLFVRKGTVLQLEREPGRAFQIDDESGVIEAAIRLLDGTRDAVRVAADLRRNWPDVSESDVEDLIAALDAERLLEDAAEPAILRPEEEARYVSGLAFFSTFADLNTSRQVFQERLRSAHVLQLGVGGLGSTVLPGLVGAGVGRITIVDIDHVELKNLTRQFLYTEADVGRPKLERAAARARALNSSIEVTAVERQITGANDLIDLLHGVDLVVCAIDQPRGISERVSEACIRHGVPMIVGGMGVTRLAYWSFWPGVSGCMRCWYPDPAVAEPVGTLPAQVNRATGAMASLVGGLVGVEALRYLTGFAPPVSAGRCWMVDLVTGACGVEDEWSRRPGCPVCGGLETPAGDDGELVVSGGTAR